MKSVHGGPSTERNEPETCVHVCVFMFVLCIWEYVHVYFHIFLYFLLQSVYEIIIFAFQKTTDFILLYMLTSFHNEFRCLMAWVEITEVFGI